MTQEIQKLIELWHRAIYLKNAGDWGAAACLIEQILLLHPNWEHGYGEFNLAECYEELGKIDDARLAYERAVASSPTDRTLVGGLASFLFLHGQPREAFDQHIQLLALERRHGDDRGILDTTTALRLLGSRLEWSSKEVESRIADKGAPAEKRG